MSTSRLGEGSATGRSGVEVVVKWFNPTKGYGFVQEANVEGDIFLHASVVQRTGNLDLPPGSRLICDLNIGPRGPQVALIHSVTLGDPSEPNIGSGGPTMEIEGRVKFFDAARGFGFVVPDDLGPDVFISARQLERAGVQSLQPEQRVRLVVGSGRRGPIALSLTLI